MLQFCSVSNSLPHTTLSIKNCVARLYCVVVMILHACICICIMWLCNSQNILSFVDSILLYSYCCNRNRMNKYILPLHDFHLYISILYGGVLWCSCCASIKIKGMTLSFYKTIYVFISLERGQISVGERERERERETDRQTDRHGDEARRKQPAMLTHNFFLAALWNSAPVGRPATHWDAP